MARTHSLKTPSRSRSDRASARGRRGARFQYIQRLGPIVAFRISDFGIADCGGVFLRNNPLSISRFNFDASSFGIPPRQVSEIPLHPFAHFSAHEHRVGADVNDPVLFEQTCTSALDLRINQRLAAAKSRSWARCIPRRRSDNLQRQDVLERGGVFADATAALQVRLQVWRAPTAKPWQTYRSGAASG